MNRHQTDLNVLIIYFSLSGQSRGLVNLFATGLKEEGISVTIEQIHALKKISFPLKGSLDTLKMMCTTFFRVHTPIHELNPVCYKSYDLIVLSGPTWSYNPSGPILTLLTGEGKKLFYHRRVLPLLSCRGYYRLHNFFLRKKLMRLGAMLEESLIFSHPVSEPWSTLGVFLKSAGYQPEQMKYLSRHYPRFGHSAEQLQQVRIYGRQVARNLKQQQTEIT